MARRRCPGCETEDLRPWMLFCRACYRKLSYTGQVRVVEARYSRRAARQQLVAELLPEIRAYDRRYQGSDWPEE